MSCEQGSVYSRYRTERRARDDRTELKRPPRCPGCRPKGGRRNRRPLPSDFELDEHIGSYRALRRVVEQVCEQGSGEPEWRIRDHPVGLGGPWDLTEVLPRDLDLVDQTRLAHPVVELANPGRVGFDRDDSSAGSSQWKGQGACASPDFDYEFTVTDTDRINEPADLTSINEEVLSE